MTTSFAEIPLRKVGPLEFAGPEVTGHLEVPLATFETPLWPSVARGAKVSRECGGIQAIISRDCMTRSIILQATSAAVALHVSEQLHITHLQTIVANTSRFATLIDIHSEIVGNLLYVRFSFTTGDASGHNMVTKASEQLLHYIMQTFTGLTYVSLSGNYCVDKKVSAINGLLGRGKSVNASMTIPALLCEQLLQTTPTAIATLNQRKNLIGSQLAGSLRSGNAHYANMLLAFYLACGQDAANIVEGSQGLTSAEVTEDGALFFNVYIPNIIVGTVGNGKNLPFVQAHLAALDCLTSRPAGQNARRLAIIAAGAVLCGELSLLAALTNPSTLMRSHEVLERR